MNRVIEIGKLKDMGLEGRANYLASCLGIEVENLIRLQSLNGNLREDILNASTFLYNSLVSQGHEKQFALSHISSGILGALIFPKEDLSKSQLSAAHAMDEQFGDSRDELSDSLGVDLTSSEIVRMKVAERSDGKRQVSSAVRASRIWAGKVKYSYYDLIRSIKVPLKLGILEAFYLGAVYPEFSAVSKKYSIRMSARREGREEFLGIMSGISQLLFNIQPGPDKTSLNLNSKAVYSWLFEVVGINELCQGSISKKFEELKRYGAVPAEQLMQAFVYGVLARKGNIRYIRNNQYLTMSNRENPLLLWNIQSISKLIGLNPGLVNGHGILNYNWRDIKAVASSEIFDRAFPYNHLGAFVNPSHIKALNASPYKPLPVHNPAS